MQRHTRLKPKRDKPRRKAPERVPGRVKRKATSPPTAAEQRHMDRIAAMPCLGCGTWPVEVHHSLTAPGKRCRRDHRFVCPLCPNCHRGSTGVHGLGSERLFGERIGLCLGAWAVAEWEKSSE